MTSTLVPLAAIRLDGGTQLRANLDPERVAEYQEHLDSLPPVVVFRDGDGAVWLADGFHRTLAFLRAGRSEIPADAREGTRRDAVLYAAGANAEHGLPRSNEDKRRVVSALLADPEWSRWSDRELARRARVGHAFVSRLRGQLSTGDSCESRIGRDGKVRRMPSPRTWTAEQAIETLDALADHYLFAAGWVPSLIRRGIEPPPMPELASKEVFGAILASLDAHPEQAPAFRVAAIRLQSAAAAYVEGLEVVR